jgi:DNA-binding XRE family transcriptional regulator
MSSSPAKDAQIKTGDVEYLQNPEEFRYRVRKKLAAILLNDLHKTPVRRIGSSLTLGAWITEVRAKTNLTDTDLAAALDVSEEWINQIGLDAYLPWTIDYRQMADLLCLFRLHLDALEQLALNSCKRDAGNLDRTVLPSWLDSVRSELTLRGSPDLIR